MTAIEIEESEKVCLVVSCTVNRKLYGIVVGKRTAIYSRLQTVSTLL